MNFDAWDTVWICVGFAALVILIDAWQANLAGPDKVELARTGQRDRRMVKVTGKGNRQ